MNTSVKTMAAVFLSVGAGFVIVNRVVTAAPWEDWLLAAALLLLAVAFAAWAWRDTHPTPVSALVTAELEAEPVMAAYEPEPAAQPDDLTLIEGIGPKMSAALAAAGIVTFGRLAQASREELEAAIAAAGMRFAPSIATWAEQAAFAARGDWEGLKAFQETLTAGRKG